MNRQQLAKNIKQVIFDYIDEMEGQDDQTNLIEEMLVSTASTICSFANKKSLNDPLKMATDCGSALAKMIMKGAKTHNENK